MNKLLLSATGMIAMTTAFTAAQSAKPQNINNPAAKPNILVILADDMRADSLGVINPYIKTPNLDRLCNQGVRFNNCYIMGGHSAAVCTASRVMLMSGRSRFNLPNDIEGGGNQPSVPVMSTVFKAAGYDTFYCGKHGNTYRPADKSFDKFKPINVQLMAVDEPLEPELARRRPYAGYITEYLAEPARKDKPSFIFFAPSIPHDPIVPEPEDLAYYTGDKLPPLPKSAATEHAAIAGFNLRDTNVRPFNVPGVGNLNAPLDLSQWRGIIARHYAYITGLDRHVGRILDELERTGADKNTIVVFSADNGHSLSDLGLIHKNSAYDQDLKVPLIIRGPGIPAGKTSDALVYLSAQDGIIES